MFSLKNVVLRRDDKTTGTSKPSIGRSRLGKLTFGLPDLNHPLSLLLAAASIPVLLFAGLDRLQRGRQPESSGNRSRARYGRSRRR